MKHLSSLVAGLRALLWRSRDVQEIDEDLREYLFVAVDERVAHGMDRAAAEREARAEIGSLLAARDEVRQTGWEHSVDCFWQDVRLGIRVLRRDAVSSVVLVLTLALGIGGTVAIVALLNTTYFRELPIPEPDRVVRLLDAFTDSDGRRQLSNMAAEHAAVILDDAELIESAVAMYGQASTLTGDFFSERAIVVYRTAGWGATLGVFPAIGRDFTPAEEALGRTSRVALISYDLWQRRFQDAPVGLVTVRLDDTVVTVVGVMPIGFRFPYEADVWMPIQPAEIGRERGLAVFSRLGRDTNREQFDTGLIRVGERIRRQSSARLPAYSVGVRTLRDNLLERQQQPMWALVSAVGCLLLLACVNVATLLTARATARGREFATRAALGANRGRQVRQLITETTVLVGAGGCLGVVIAALSVQSMSVLIPANISVQLGLSTPVVDLRVLGSSVAITLGAAFISSIAPAFRTARSASEALAGESRTVPPARWPLRVLVIVQSALALALVAAAGLALSSVDRLRHRDRGFELENLLTGQLTLPNAAHDGDRGAHVRALIDRVARQPGVTAVGATSTNPLRGSNWAVPISFDDEPTDGDRTVTVRHHLVSPGLFRAMGVPLLRGRDFAWTDSANQPNVVIISAQLARRMGPLDAAIGRRLRMAVDRAHWLTIVGIVGDPIGAGSTGPEETWYLPYLQHAGSTAANELHLMVRVHQDLAASPAATVDPTVPGLAADQIVAMTAYQTDSLRPHQSVAVVIAGAGVFGLLLAALGTYGITTCSASHRTRELALRAILGTSRRTLTHLLLREAALVNAIGLVTGAAVALGLNRLMAGLLPDVAPVEPLILVSAAGILLVVAAAAAYIPATRSASLDPLAIIREA